MKNQERELTLAQPATYQIKVPGVLGERCFTWNANLTITLESAGDGKVTSTITSICDQAALHGLLRRLYFLGLPLISVIWTGTI